MIRASSMLPSAIPMATPGPCRKCPGDLQSFSVCFLAENIVAQNSTQDSLQLAHRLYASEVHQARMLATLIFGKLAALSPEAFSFLKEQEISGQCPARCEQASQRFSTG